MRLILKALSLQPYGQQLATPSARVWMMFAAAAALLMAATEATAWGYVGYWLAGGWMRWATAALVGAAVFLTIWLLDATLLTFDFERKGDPNDRGGWRRWFQTINRGVAGITIRLLLALGSLAVSAPYITQMIFRNDIAGVLFRADAAQVAAARNGVAARYDAEIAEARETERQLRDALIREAAGVGPSGRFGRGPTVRTMEERLAEIRNYVAQIALRKEEELRTFDTLSRADLADRYGVRVTPDGLQARTAAMEEVQRQPGFKRTEWTIRAFLFGIFLLVLTLKIFQPRSVRLYYSEERQDCYEQYCAGHFDDLLPAHERISNGGTMTPLRFDDWCRNEYAAYINQARTASRLGVIMARQQTEESNMRRVELTARQDLQPFLEDYEKNLAGIADLESELLKIKAELASVQSEAESHRKAIAELDRSIAYPQAVGAERFARSLDIRKEWEGGLTSFERQAVGLQLRVDTLSAQISIKRDEAARMQNMIATEREVLNAAREHIKASRNRALDAIRATDSESLPSS